MSCVVHDRSGGLEGLLRLRRYPDQPRPRGNPPVEPRKATRGRGKRGYGMKIRVMAGLVLLSMFGILSSGGVQAQSSQQPPPLVARVAYVDGELLRYVPAEEDWVATVADSPVGPKDVFYSDKAGRAEISFPNRTLGRLGPATQMEVVGLEDDLTDLYVASGQVRVYNRSSDTYMRVSTPFGYMVGPRGTVADLYVGDESAEIIALQGTIQFIRTRDGYEAKYDVAAGGSSLLVDRDGAARGEGTVDADWDQWNRDRDRFWGQRQRVRSEYLPEPLQDDAAVLEESGRWERVYYDGEYRTLWRPTVVEAGWAPYTVGRWATWYDEQVWIPYEPFGYVTHHYGHWVPVGGFWYWMPPVVTVSVGVPWPRLYWYPGRVAWIHTDVYVGWVPLAPWEPYYAVHAWGPGVTIWAGGVMPAIAIGSLAFVDYAICVHHHHFWGVHHHHGYYGVRVTNINKTVIINNFRAAPVVHKTVFKNVAFAKNQYRFVDRDVHVKPHKMVVNQIKERQQKLQPVKASVLNEKLQKAPKGDLAAGKRIAEPKITNKMVKAEMAGKPEARFEEVKPKAKPGKPKLEAVGPAQTKPAVTAEPKGKAAGEKPPGWDKGRKQGWEGTVPPGQEKPKPGAPGKPGVAGRPDRPETQEKPKTVEKPKAISPKTKPEGIEPSESKPPRPGSLDRPKPPVKPEGMEGPTKKPPKPETQEGLGRPKRPKAPEETTPGTLQTPPRPGGPAEGRRPGPDRRREPGPAVEGGPPRPGAVGPGHNQTQQPPKAEQKGKAKQQKGEKDKD